MARQPLCYWHVNWTVYRAERQTFARFCKTFPRKAFHVAEYYWEEFKCVFYLWNTPNFLCFHRSLDKSQVIFHSLSMHFFSCDIVRRYLTKNFFMQQIWLRTKCESSARITPSEPAFSEARWTSVLVQQTGDKDMSGEKEVWWTWSELQGSSNSWGIVAPEAGFLPPYFCSYEHWRSFAREKQGTAIF